MKTLLQSRVLLAAALLATAGAAQAGPVLDRVKAAQTVRVCIWPDYYGITFRNPRTQQLGGIDIDLSAEFGRDAKWKVEYVESSFQKLVDDLKGDRCDVAMFAVGVLLGVASMGATVAGRGRVPS